KTSTRSSIDELEFEMLKERLKRFCELQNEHFSKGWRVSACEKELNNEFCGIKIEGKIDRIDINENGELCVIDYKTGSLPKNDLQLQFYKALSGASKGYFIDLKESMDFDEKKASQRAKPVILEAEIQKIKDFFAGRNDGFVCSCGGKEHGYSFKELLKGQL
ncbi:MAG: PD-(D/E)XK nuclease family protein, partial [Campylobacter sp.]|nr:PD-(D/E)XK nuclease family protein [Campylobacter sp.]